MLPVYGSGTTDRKELTFCTHVGIDLNSVLINFCQLLRSLNGSKFSKLCRAKQFFSYKILLGQLFMNLLVNM